MHSLLLTSLALFAYIIPGSTVPVINKRFDVDGNGVPDLCTATDNGETQCLEPDDTWTTINVPAATTPTATSIAVTPTGATAVASPTGTLPDPATFKAQNGTAWTIEFVGNLGFTEEMQTKGLGGDKCRTSVLGETTIWNCGDMECGMDSDSGASYMICGFAMGPAFYGTLDVMTVDTNNLSLVQNNEFAQPWIGDSPPQAPQTDWGMDTSNIAPINATNGVAYVWEIWRGAPDGSFVNRGAGAVSVTLGDDKPVATRVGPLLSGPDAVQLGLFAVMSDGGYVYTYTMGGPTGMMVGRVPAGDEVFDASNYEFLSASDFSTWTTPGSIPTNTSNEFGMQTADTNGQFACNVYGSVFYSTYLNRYVLLCTLFMSQTNMYVSENAWGPWSAQYNLLEGWGPGYGSHAHPQYSEDNGKTWYFSQGPNGRFDMFKVTLP